MTLEIFDPALCCPTGVCGPDTDPELIRIASDIHRLQQQKMEVQRYNLAQDPGAFVEHEGVSRLIDEKGTDILPVSVLDGEIVKTGAYPDRRELSEWLGIEQYQLEKKKNPTRVDISIR
ncbi:arsenite efflux transporter metallochaperone ArsD [Salibacterium aidingense]|uniref:arsenite efflux transporter metallochaperone ArsD n=1 Tax=Salibacterium aidingense TaxID=384933 RepID=UPI0003F937B1|nr:arsenite efflux transporter metallochaperone ArsD [Salibacterium aidingense]